MDSPPSPSARPKAEPLDEVADPPLDGVPDRPYPNQFQARRVCQLPILVSLAGDIRTRITATHRHDDVGSLQDRIGPWSGTVVSDVDADLGHRGDGGGNDAGGPIRA